MIDMGWSDEMSFVTAPKMQDGQFALCFAGETSDYTVRDLKPVYASVDYLVYAEEESFVTFGKTASGTGVPTNPNLTASDTAAACMPLQVGYNGKIRITPETRYVKINNAAGGLVRFIPSGT